MATIITTHMPRNEIAAPAHVCPSISIQVIDIVQPPGIVIPPIDDMERPQTMVTAALAAKSSAEMPKKTRPPACPAAMLRRIFLLPLSSIITSPGFNIHRDGATSCLFHYDRGERGPAI